MTRLVMKLQKRRDSEKGFQGCGRVGPANGEVAAEPGELALCVLPGIGLYGFNGLFEGVLAVEIVEEFLIPYRPEGIVMTPGQQSFCLFEQACRHHGVDALVNTLMELFLWEVEADDLYIEGALAGFA